MSIMKCINTTTDKDTTMENQHRQIKGYRELTQVEIDLMNAIKTQGEIIGRLVESMRADPTLDRPEKRCCDECGHKGTDGGSTTESYCGSCGATVPYPEDDLCSECGATSCMLIACPECGGHYSLDEEQDDDIETPACAARADLREENERLRATNKNARDAIQAGITINVELQAEVERLRAQIDALQARVDALMLEFCPGEMTEDQKETWARHQRPASDEDRASAGLPGCAAREEA